MNYMISEGGGDSREPTLQELAEAFAFIRKGLTVVYEPGDLVDSDPPNYVLIDLGGGEGIRGRFTIIVARPDLDAALWLDLPKRVGGAAVVLNPDAVRRLIAGLTEAIGQVEEPERPA